MNTAVSLVVPSGSYPEAYNHAMTAVIIHCISKNKFYKHKWIFSATEPFLLKETTSMNYSQSGVHFFVTGHWVHSKWISSPWLDILAFP